MDFIDENEFVVANYSYPTYHSHLNNNEDDIKDINNEDEINQKGETVLDVTFFYSSYDINIRNWYRQHPIGKCHHNILEYEINLRNSINPLRNMSNKNERKYKMPIVNWKKTDWIHFNEVAVNSIMKYINYNKIINKYYIDFFSV